MTDDEQGHAGRTVVGVDGSPGARIALGWALADAARRGAPVEVVSSFPVQLYLADPLLLDEKQLEAVRADTLGRAGALVDEVRAEVGQPDVPVQVLAVAGPPAPMLLAAAEDAGLLVVGSRGRGAVKSLVLGSVALSCVTHARVPVVVVHAGAADATADSASGPPRVVVGLDGSAASGAALERAATEAQLLGAEVVAVAAYSAASYWSDAYAVVMPPPEQLAGEVRAAAEQQVAGARLPDGVPVRVESLEGPAGNVLVEAARDAALLVVGGHGQGAVRGLLMGSVALHCVLSGPCPVMVVPEGEDAGRHASAG
ncbi:Nucleotide-binding universal stress protein, UspA family [Blastococcus aggregatus]|uniref:Nucleotide-binding universal stress protein, UspA family n=1 Tax=Blastococcus aggregatus TaxID=38502 RepID=A0A285V6X7_9ACTN|nr:universal stress protein [Blastococcus aggregatus]SOC49763.1 Nucleotide-binding universal stress protein, UspA family [Blastococcus aggregatus]